MKIERGKFIVLLSPNNTGKSEQVRRLADKLSVAGIDVYTRKWPVYELEPTGPLLNKILREHHPSTPLETQKIFAQNRRDYQPTLETMLESGIWVVGEDYTETGISWGMTYGLSRKVLEQINHGLTRQDLSIYIDSCRFVLGIEKGHLHEDGGLWEKNRDIHRKLSKLYSWEVVDGNGRTNDIEVNKAIVADRIWTVVERRLLNQ